MSQGLIYDYSALMQKLSAEPHVLAVTPLIHGIALVQNGNRVIFPKCLGFDPETVNRVLPLSQFIIQDNKSDGAFISHSIARELNLKPGDTFDLYSPLSLESIKNEEIILPQEIEVAGLFKTDWAEIDRDTIFFPLKQLQESFGMHDSVHGFSLHVERPYIATVCSHLNTWLPASMHAYSWKELNEDFLHVLRMEKSMSFFVLLFIVLVAAITISSGLMACVVRKQREISLLLTWGASRLNILALFCLQGIVLSFLGTSLGLLGGYGVLHFRNEIMHILTGWLIPQNALWNFYDFEKLPVAYNAHDIGYIIGFTFIITLLASFLPASKATRTSTIKGLRSE